MGGNIVRSLLFFVWEDFRLFFTTEYLKSFDQHFSLLMNRQGQFLDLYFFYFSRDGLGGVGTGTLELADFGTVSNITFSLYFLFILSDIRFCFGIVVLAGS